MSNEYLKVTLLSVDAWREPEGGWTWNNWFTIEKDIFLNQKELSSRHLFKWLRDNDFLTDQSKGKMSLDDDGHNLTICLRNTGQPVMAFCYGDHWEANGL